jgi:hypothetical protein
MVLDGVLLNNNLATFSKPLVGSGTELVVTVTAEANGGTEAVAFQNLVIVGSPAATEIVAFDMVGSASQNLNSFVNFAPPFSSLGDCFGKEQRPNGPFAVLDDSLSIFPADTQGIIKEGNVDEFFCIVDLAIDIGAMGDFEAGGDYFRIEAAIDGGVPQLLFESTVDEAGSQDYTLEGGAMSTLNDPMVLDGVLLNNNLATFSKPLVGSGTELVVTVTAEAFQ